jgi:O-antigen/teichoic acid export membrane protein
VVSGNAVETLADCARVIALLHIGGEAMLGSLALAFAICTPVYGMASLGLRSAIATDAKGEYRFGDYLAVRLATSALGLLVVVGLVAAGGHSPTAAAVVLLIALGEMFAAVSDVFHALQQQHERMDLFAGALMIRAPLSVAAMLLGVWWTGSLVAGVAAYPLVAAAVLLFYDLPNARRILAASRPAWMPRSAPVAPRWRPSTMLRLVRLAAPLGVVIMVLGLQSSVPRYVVAYWLGNHGLGVFVSIYYLGMAGSRAVAAIGQSSGPRLARHYAAGDTSAYVGLLGRVLLPVLAISIATVGALAALGGPILALIYRPEFASYAGLAVWLMVAASAGYVAQALGAAVEAMRHFKTHMVIRSLGIALLVISAPHLVRSHGLHGMAVAMLLSSGFMAIGCVGSVGWGLRTCRTGGVVPIHVVREERPMPLRRAA